MSAETVQRPDGQYDVFYEGELAAENVPLHEAERLLDLYDMTEQACDAARDKYELERQP